MLAGILGLAWMLDMSLSSKAEFIDLQDKLSSAPCKLALFLVLSALTYHTAAGVRHLIMDLGFGETKEGGRLGAKIMLAVSAIIIVLMGVWVW